jgi:hypothetical protein
VDVAFDEDSGKWVTGVVIRDSTDGCIAAMQTFLPHVVDAAEAYAFRDGLTLAQQIGPLHVNEASGALPYPLKKKLSLLLNPEGALALGRRRGCRARHRFETCLLHGASSSTLDISMIHP